jgi:hypothetical protein
MAVKRQEAAHIATVYNDSPEPKMYKAAKQRGTKESLGVPKNKICQKYYWSLPVLASKDDGRSQARCISKGFSPIPGKGFQESHAPVILDTTLHLLMVIETVLHLEAGKFNKETEFLSGKTEKDQWMTILDGHQDYVKEKFNEYIDPKTHCSNVSGAI